MDPAFHPLPRVTATNCTVASLGKKEGGMPLSSEFFYMGFSLAEMFLISHITLRRK